MDFVQSNFNTTLSAKDIGLMGAGAALWDKPLAQIKQLEDFVTLTAHDIHAAMGSPAINPLYIEKVGAAFIYAKANKGFAGNKAWINKAISGILIDVSRELSMSYLRPMIPGSLAGVKDSEPKGPTIPAGMSPELYAALAEASGGI